MKESNHAVRMNAVGVHLFDNELHPTGPGRSWLTSSQ